MNPERARRALLDALSSVAPEADYEHLRADRPLRDQIDLDSFDFLKVIVQLHDVLGIDIPESDYQKLATLEGAVSYLAARAGTGSGA
ncbi:MAG TPA: phosphopantetheine-binding protein [Burkholderiales bacterium]|nr:phosphopantetheine-binding protein [Burkholderiales bacterium]